MTTSEVRLAAMPAWLVRAPWNELAFAARTALAFSRGVPTFLGEPSEPLFPFLDGASQAAATTRDTELRARYDLAGLRAAVSAEDYRENIALCDALERATADVTPPSPLRQVVDIGCGRFAYAPALHRFLARWGATTPSKLVLDGWELDGHVLLAGAHSRADHGRAFAALADAARVSYRVGDFARAGRADVDVVTLLYPFLTRRALVAWGLPLRCFDPTRLVAAACRALRPGGVLVVFNQTDDERALLAPLLAASGMVTIKTTPIASRLVAYADATADRVATVARRPGSAA